MSRKRVKGNGGRGEGRAEQKKGLSPEELIPLGPGLRKVPWKMLRRISQKGGEPQSKVSGKGMLEGGPRHEHLSCCQGSKPTN